MRNTKKQILKSRSIQLEKLEERWTPASISLVGMELRLNGDNAVNNATVSYVGRNVVATISSGSSTARMSVDASRVGSVSFRGGEGNDSFVNGLTNIPSQAWGGNGNDRLVGANATDQFWGGAGNDTLIGNGAVDYLYGELGNDSIDGGFGNDFISGGSELGSVDQLNGGQGIDAFEDGFVSNRWSLDGTQARDVEQGTVGSCSTLSSMAQLANQGFNFASRITQVASDTYRVTMDGLGQQLVKFNGTWNDQDAEPRAVGNQREFWTVLFHRARLQAYGVNIANYIYESADWNQANANFGGRLANPQAVLQDFTGRAGTAIAIDTVASHISPQAMRDFLNSGGLAVAGSWLGARDSVLNGLGIAGQHAYAVLNVWQANGQWMVRLYNPWGTDMGNGRAIGDQTDDGFITLSWNQFVSRANFSALFLA